MCTFETGDDVNIVSDKEFYDVFDYAELTVLGNTNLERCLFAHCAVGLTKDFNKRTKIHDLILKDCAVSNRCSIGAAVLENVTVENLYSDNELSIFDNVFPKTKII